MFFNLTENFLSYTYWSKPSKNLDINENSALIGMLFSCKRSVDWNLLQNNKEQQFDSSQN